MAIRDRRKPEAGTMPYSYFEYVYVYNYPADAGRWVGVRLALIQRREWWTSVRPALIRRLVSTSKSSSF